MLLKTRFYLPPLRRNSVIRRCLIERLNSTAGGGVILVSAPPGYGKTTLLSQWLHESPHLFGWVMLDDTQSDPIRFWGSVVGVINAVQPGIGASAQQLLQDNPTDLSTMVVSLLNDLDSLSTLNSASPLTLVLDDFHKINHEETLKSVNLFLDHLPSSIRVALTARQQPPLQLARRRANHQLTEFNHHDLTLDEIDGERFLNQTMGLTLNSEDASQLISKTEGWVAGLQLVGLTLNRHRQSVSEWLESLNIDNGLLNREIADYLFEEAFASQPDQLKQFLVKTALPSKFCAAFANAMLGVDNGYPMIKRLDQLNLFLVPLDNHYTWFRYHDSFRQFLLQRFSELSPGVQATQHDKATAWLDAGGYLDVVLGNPSPRFESAVAQNDDLDKDLDDAFHATVVPLTKREQQVMACLKEGYSNKQIAETLHISLNTLKVHIRNLYGKMGVENRSQALVKMANQPPSNP